MARPTLRTLSGLPEQPAPLSASTLVLIDCQETYRAGTMQLEGVEEALAQARILLERARALGRPVIHIAHDDGPGGLYDHAGETGRICAAVAPVDGEPVVVKAYPNAFLQTDLEERLRRLDAANVVLAGFMTHMCVNSTARAAFNLGFGTTVVASASATRALPGPDGESVPAKVVHAAALAGLGDLFAVVAPSVDAIAD